MVNDTIPEYAFICRFARTGSNIIEAITRDGREALREGKLVLLRQDASGSSEGGQFSQQLFASRIGKVTVEQRGPVRAVVKVEDLASLREQKFAMFNIFRAKEGTSRGRWKTSHAGDR